MPSSRRVPCRGRITDVAKKDFEKSAVCVSVLVAVGIPLILVAQAVAPWLAARPLLEALRTGSPVAKESAIRRLGYDSSS